jgi:hypothetical protein
MLWHRRNPESHAPNPERNAKIKMTESVTRSLRGAEGDEAILVGDGDVSIDIVAGFIPALWSGGKCHARSYVLQ